MSKNRRALSYSYAANLAVVAGCYCGMIFFNLFLVIGNFSNWFLVLLVLVTGVMHCND